MGRLDQQQVALIEADVQSARITLSHLSHELVDHICCEVEGMMSNGKSFEEAYVSVKEQVGIQVLQQIQENTLYLINKHYAFMKTAMKITGNIALAMLGVGTLLKIFHLPGANVTLVLGFALVCLFFFPAAIYFNYQDKQVKGKLLMHFSILLGGMSFMAGILFKVMYWQGANMLLLGGWVLMLGVFLPLLLLEKMKEAATAKERWTYVLGVVSLLVFEVSTLFKFFHYPGATVLMVIGSVMLVSLFLPLYTYRKFKESGRITGQFIFLVIACFYAISFTVLLRVNTAPPAQSQEGAAARPLPSSTLPARAQPMEATEITSAQTVQPR